MAPPPVLGQAGCVEESWTLGIEREIAAQRECCQCAEWPGYRTAM